MSRYQTNWLLPWLVAAIAVLPPIGTSGADTFQIEIDYMGADTDGHDHMPSPLVLDAVVQMFACQGHTLIIDLSDEIPHYDYLVGNPDDNCSGLFSYTGLPNTYASIRDIYRDHGAGWHYCIFAHQWQTGRSDPNDPEGCYPTTSSGVASGGDAFIVSLGAFSGQTGTPFQQAATLAHEFGHNLGLSHCGECAGDSAYLLNMPSIMTYQYQLIGVRSGMTALGLIPPEALFKELNYSHGRLCGLYEPALDETRGTVMMPVDFNCDDDAFDINVVQDLNFRGLGIGSSAPWCGEADVDYAYLVDYDEWANIEDGAALMLSCENGDSGAAAELQRRRDLMEPCITKEEWDLIALDMQLGGRADLEVEACITGLNVFIGDNEGSGSGDCPSPYVSVQNAQSSSPSGSVYFLSPGVYDESGTTTLSKPGVYTCRTGIAEIR